MAEFEVDVDQMSDSSLDELQKSDGDREASREEVAVVQAGDDQGLE